MRIYTNSYSIDIVFRQPRVDGAAKLATAPAPPLDIYAART